MTIASAPFVGVAVPLDFSPISKAYWQSDAAVKDIALRFSLKSNKATTKRAGKARLVGVCCKDCSQELVVNNREHAISEIKTVGSYRGVQCTPCFRIERQKKAMELITGGPNSPVSKRQHQNPYKPSRKPKHKLKAPSVSSKEQFYKSWEWRTIRMEVLTQHGRACQCCGAEPGMKTAAGEPVRICVDHIKPLSKFWHLRLDRTNLQVLCDECNQGKGAWDQTDFRKPEAPDEWVIEDAEISHAIAAALEPHAEKRALSVPQLVDRLIGVITSDNLVDPLLDDGVAA